MPRSPGGDAGGDPSRALFRRFASTWALAIVALVALEIVTRPFADLPGMVTLVSLTAGAGFAMLFAALALSRDRPGRWPIVATIALDLVALAVAWLSASGNDTAVFLPYLGALLLVWLLDERELRLAFAIQWLVGTIASLIAYGFGQLRTLPGADPVVVSVAASGAMMLVGYGLLWWVRDRLNRALAGARTAEARVRRSATAMETLLAASPVATIGFDLHGAIESWNPAAQRLFGWGLADVRGSDPDVMAGDEGDAPSAVVARVLDGEAVDSLRVTWRAHDGTPVVLALHAALLVGPDARPTGVVLQAIDETEREALRTRVAEVQRLEAVGQLAGGIAHDFNNLLTAVAGYAELIGESLPEGDPIRADAREIMRASARGAELVRQLLAFGRRQRVRSVVLSVNELVGDLRPMLVRLIGAQARIQVDLDPDVPPVDVDPGQIEQVIVNLVVNARDAMPSGGDITIRTATHRAADGSVHARLSVADTGHGMDAATQARVFEPFFTTKPAGRGTGLGLATVYGIVTSHGGAIHVLSRLGRGTTFAIDLPAASPVVAPRVVAPASGAAPARGRGSGTVLVVDDEESVRRLAARALTADGYRVLEAGDLWTALDLATREEGAIDLVLSDVVMPDCRGPELVRRIARFHPEARVLFMTGYDDSLPGAQLEDLEALGGRVLGKPFSVAELARAVQALILDPAPVA